MQLRFDAMEIDNTLFSDVNGLLDSATGTLRAAFHKRAKSMLDYYMAAGNVVIGVRSEMHVPVFLPKAKMESILVDDNSELLHVVFRFQLNSSTFKRPN